MFGSLLSKATNIAGSGLNSITSELNSLASGQARGNAAQNRGGSMGANRGGRGGGPSSNNRGNFMSGPPVAPPSNRGGGTPMMGGNRGSSTITSSNMGNRGASSASNRGTPMSGAPANRGAPVTGNRGNFGPNGSGNRGAPTSGNRGNLTNGHQSSPQIPHQPGLGPPAGGHIPRPDARGPAGTDTQGAGDKNVLMNISPVRKYDSNSESVHPSQPGAEVGTGGRGRGGGRGGGPMVGSGIRGHHVNGNRGNSTANIQQKQRSSAPESKKESGGNDMFSSFLNKATNIAAGSGLTTEKAPSTGTSSTDMFSSFLTKASHIVESAPTEKSSGSTGSDMFSSFLNKASNIAESALTAELPPVISNITSGQAKPTSTTNTASERKYDSAIGSDSVATKDKGQTTKDTKDSIFALFGQGQDTSQSHPDSHKPPHKNIASSPHDPQGMTRGEDQKNRQTQRQYEENDYAKSTQEYSYQDGFSRPHDQTGTERESSPGYSSTADPQGFHQGSHDMYADDSIQNLEGILPAKVPPEDPRKNFNLSYCFTEIPKFRQYLVAYMALKDIVTCTNINEIFKRLIEFELKEVRYLDFSGLFNIRPWDEGVSIYNDTDESDRRQMSWNLYKALLTPKKKEAVDKIGDNKDKANKLGDTDTSSQNHNPDSDKTDMKDKTCKEKEYDIEDQTNKPETKVGDSKKDQEPKGNEDKSKPDNKASKNKSESPSESNVRSVAASLLGDQTPIVSERLPCRGMCPYSPYSTPKLTTTTNVDSSLIGVKKLSIPYNRKRSILKWVSNHCPKLKSLDVFNDILFSTVETIHLLLNFSHLETLYVDLVDESIKPRVLYFGEYHLFGGIDGDDARDWQLRRKLARTLILKNKESLKVLKIKDRISAAEEVDYGLDQLCKLKTLDLSELSFWKAPHPLVSIPVRQNLPDDYVVKMRQSPLKLIRTGNPKMLETLHLPLLLDLRDPIPWRSIETERKQHLKEITTFFRGLSGLRALYANCEEDCSCIWHPYWDGILWGVASHLEEVRYNFKSYCNSTLVETEKRKCYNACFPNTRIDRVEVFSHFHRLKSLSTNLRAFQRYNVALPDLVQLIPRLTTLKLLRIVEESNPLYQDFDDLKHLANLQHLKILHLIFEKARAGMEMAVNFCPEWIDQQVLPTLSAFSLEELLLDFKFDGVADSRNHSFPVIPGESEQIYHGYFKSPLANKLKKFSLLIRGENETLWQLYPPLLDRCGSLLLALTDLSLGGAMVLKDHLATFLYSLPKAECLRSLDLVFSPEQPYFFIEKPILFSELIGSLKLQYLTIKIQDLPIKKSTFDKFLWSLKFPRGVKVKFIAKNSIIFEN